MSLLDIVKAEDECLMHEKLDFELVEGEKTPCDIQLYALSTCGFCKRGIAFLRDNNIRFRFLYVDHLDKDTRTKIKRDLMNKFEDVRVGYPFVIIDGKDAMVGFTEEKWKNAFLE